mmetsp:Transcript_17880/g.43957  ORF Transcript_17880/g.43957 Transcript_17880/m.43957 type:complete len:246 (-) Transcript_17880:616-1353(-)
MHISSRSSTTTMIRTRAPPSSSWSSSTAWSCSTASRVTTSPPATCQRPPHVPSSVSSPVLWPTATRRASPTATSSLTTCSSASRVRSSSSTLASRPGSTQASAARMGLGTIAGGRTSAAPAAMLRRKYLQGAVGTGASPRMCGVWVCASSPCARASFPWTRPPVATGASRASSSSCVAVSPHRTPSLNSTASHARGLQSLWSLSTPCSCPSPSSDPRWRRSSRASGSRARRTRTCSATRPRRRAT